MHLTKTNGYWYVRRSTADGKETVVKLGQHDGRPAIYRPELVQDKAENLLARLPDGSVDCLIMDPPYGISFESGRQKYDGATDFGGLMNDSDGDLSFLDGLADELDRVLSAESWAYVFCRGDVLPLVAQRLAPEFTDYRTLVWYKNGHGMGDLTDWAPSHELILAYRRGNADIHGRRPQDVLTQSGFNTGANRNVQIHPTQKPRELCERLIRRSTHTGDIVLDPFGGSYATARAAMRTFRRAVSCELDPETHRAAVDLTEKQLHDDPEHGTDWTDVTNLRVEDVDLVRPLTTA
jgi:hypothetical protein